MTRDEIIKLAREADLWLTSDERIAAVERFAALAAAAEREACAQVCEQRAGTVSMFPTSRDAKLHNQAVTGDAAAIRARGNL